MYSHSCQYPITCRLPSPSLSPPGNPLSLFRDLILQCLLCHVQHTRSVLQFLATCKLSSIHHHLDNLGRMPCDRIRTRRGDHMRMVLLMRIVLTQMHKRKDRCRCRLRDMSKAKHNVNGAAPVPRAKTGCGLFSYNRRAPLMTLQPLLPRAPML